MCNFISDIMNWWFRSLRPRADLGKKRARLLRLELRNHQFSLTQPGQRQSANDQRPWAEIEDLNRQRASKVMEIGLSDAMFVNRRLTNIALPDSDAIKMAMLDLKTSTSFEKDDVYVNIDVPPLNAKTGTNYQIIRKDILDGKLAKLREAGVKTDALVLPIDGRELSVSIADLQHFGSRKLINAKMIFVLIWAFAAVGTYVHYLHRYDRAEAALKIHATELEDRALEVRRMLDGRQKVIDDLEAVRRSQNSTPSLIFLWEELTRALPDTAYLTDLKLSNREVTIAGFARSAAGLLPALEASESFDAVEFNGPVVNVPGQDGQRFTLSMRTGL